MTVSQSRRWNSALLFVFLLAGVGLAFLPYYIASRQMQRFCRELPAGTSIAEVQKRAAESGYDISAVVDGRATVHEARSFGRLMCDLQYGESGLVSAKFNSGD